MTKLELQNRNHAPYREINRTENRLFWEILGSGVIMAAAAAATYLFLVIT